MPTETRPGATAPSRSAPTLEPSRRRATTGAAARGVAPRAELGPPFDDLPLTSARLLNTPRSHRTFMRWLLGLLIVFVAAMFLPWQQNVQGTGSVTALRPQDRPQTLPTLIDGRIERWFVQEGQRVRKGEPIAQISEIKEDYLDPQVVQRTTEERDGKAAALDDKRRVAEALAQQVVALEEGLRLKLDQNRNKIVQYEAAVRAAELDSVSYLDQHRRRRALADSGLSSLNDLQSAQLRAQKANADLAEKRAALLNARIDLGSIDAEYREKITKARADRAKTLAELNEGRADVAKLSTKVASLTIRNGFYRIDAPQDGYVVRASKSGVGETVKAGEAIATVQPANPQQAVELYVRPMDVPLLRTGRKVRLQFDGWPALQFSGWPSVSVGTFGGEIAVIDQVSSTDGRFRVLVVPDPRDEPWPKQLRMGSGVYGWAMLDQVRVWFEIWRQLNGFPPSVRPPADDALTPASGAAGARGGDERSAEKK